MRRRTGLNIAMAVAAGSLALAACSSAGGSTAGNSGKAIKIMVITSIGTSISDHPDAVAGAKAAALAINGGGGINGQKITVLTCNDQSDPNVALACARTAITSKVTAVIDNSLSDSGFLPLLAAQHIPALSPIGLTPVDLTSPASFPFQASEAEVVAALPFALAKAGHHRMAIIAIDVPATHVNVQSLAGAASKAGIKIVYTGYFPAGTSDFSPFTAAAAKAGADSVLLLADQTDDIQVIQTGVQSGMKITWATALQDIGPQQIAQLGSAANGVLLTDSSPEIPSAGSTYPAIAQFNAEMAAAGRAGVADTNQIGNSFMTWMAVHALDVVGKTVSGTLTSGTFWDALQKAKDVNLLGLYTWTPNQAGPGSYLRYPNGDVWYFTVQDGKITLGSKTPLNAYSLQGLG